MTLDRVPRDADASLAGLARLAALIVIGALGLLSGCGSSHSSGAQHCALGVAQILGYQCPFLRSEFAHVVHVSHIYDQRARATIYPTFGEVQRT